MFTARTKNVRMLEHQEVACTVHNLREPAPYNKYICVYYSLTPEEILRGSIICRLYRKRPRE